VDFAPALANRHAATMSIESAAYTANASRCSRQMVHPRVAGVLQHLHPHERERVAPMMQFFQNTGDPS